MFGLALAANGVSAVAVAWFAIRPVPLLPPWLLGVSGALIALSIGLAFGIRNRDVRFLAAALVSVALLLFWSWVMYGLMHMVAG